MPGLQAFGASLELLMELGPEAVSGRILERAERVRESARAAGWRVYGSDRPDDLSGIVALERPGTDPDRFARELRGRGIALACAAAGSASARTSTTTTTTSDASPRP